MQGPGRLVTTILILILLLPPLSYSPSNTERIIILVSDSPLLKRAKTLGLSVSAASDLFEDRLRQAVEWRLDNLRRAGVEFRVIDILTHVLHGAVIETSQPIEVLKSAAPDLAVYRDESLKINLKRSSRVVGAVEAHGLKTESGASLTGQGVVVAVLDTGVDYTHPDLGGTIGPDQKILKGYDFVDEDEDPIDQDGHGTEVAGIIAAAGRITGIAPEASLLAYRVVDRMGNVRSSDLIRALERASLDGADVINLSLGTKEKIDALSYAIENLVRSGVVVVAAIGNSAERAFGEPAARKDVIAVGASLNNVTSPQDAEVIVNPGGFELIAFTMNGSKPAPEGVNGSLIYVKYAREKDLAPLDLHGKIALAERGGEPGELVYFSEKEANVASRGAAGLIIYNSQGGLFLGNLIGPHNPPGYTPRLPVVSISHPDGEYLQKALSRGEDIQVTVLTSYRSANLADRVAVFSSRGPTSPFYVKPDILAPGVSINTTTIRGGYAVGDGTSFSAPHVAGAAALLLQAHPNITPEEVAGILAPTSKVLTDRWKRVISSFIQGSGRLDVFSAALSPLALKPYYLVFHLAAGQPDQIQTLNLIPVGDQDVSVSVDVSWSFGSNISLGVSRSAVKVERDTPSKIDVTALLFHATPGYYEGRISLRPSDGYPDLTVPVVVYVNNASLTLEKIGYSYRVSVQSDTEFTGGTVRIISPFDVEQTYDLPSGGSVSVDLPYSGEYRIEAKIDTPSGTLYARGVYNVSQSIAQFSGIPVRFLGVLGGFLLLAVLVASVMIAVNRKNRRLLDHRM